MDVRGAKSFP
jgi:hypothetical protein